MPWVVSFLVSWALFFALVDFHTLKTHVSGGLLTLAAATLVDWGGQHLGLYKFYDLIIPWFGCSAFYIFGPVFTMGIIFSQYVPRRKWLQVLHIVMTSVFYLALEYFIIHTPVAAYARRHLLASAFVDVMTLSALTWVTTTFLKKEGSSLFT